MPIDGLGLGEIGADTVPNQLTYPGVSQAIIERALPHVIMPQLFTRLPSMGKQSVTIPKEIAPNDANLARASTVGPGDEIPFDILGFEAQTITVRKIARGHPVTGEDVRFQQFPMVQQRLRRLGFVMGNTVNFDAQSRVDSGRTTANDVDAIAAGAGGRTLGLNGTEFDRAGSIGQYAIIDAKKNIMQKNLDPDVLAVSPQGYTDISRLPQYSAQLLYGTPAFQNAERGFIEGLRLLVSTIVKGPTGATGSGYVVATGVTSSSLGQFTPMGYMVEALPIVTTVKEEPSRDGYAVYSLTMYELEVTKGDCIARINYSAAGL